MTNSPQIPGNFTAFNTLSFGNSEENYHPLAINNISKKKCNNKFLDYVCLCPVIFTLLLLLLSSIYTNVMLQLFLLTVDNKLGDYDLKRMTELYYNVSHNAYIMCKNDPLLTNPALCYLS